MFDIEYREVVVADLPQIERLYWQHRNDFDPPMTKEKIKTRINWFRTKKFNVIVAVDRQSREVLGFASYRVTRKYWTLVKGVKKFKKRGELHSQLVSSKARGLGIGTKLNNHVKVVLFTKGVNDVHVKRSPLNKAGENIDSKSRFNNPIIVVDKKAGRKKTPFSVVRTFSVPVLKKRRLPR
jgi:hypothetical protein